MRTRDADRGAIAMGGEKTARGRRFHLPAVLALGMVSQVGQVVLLRELLMVFHGNELSIGLILASWLAWVGVGSRLGAVVADRTTHLERSLNLSAAGVLVALPATVLLIRVLRGFFDVLPGAYLSLLDMTVSSLLLIAPVGLLLGAQFVLLAKIWREAEGARDTSAAGKTYVGEAAGNTIGGVLFTFLAVHYLNPMQTAVIAGALMLAAGLLVTTGRGVGRKGWWRGGRAAPLLLLPFAAVSWPILDQLDRRAYEAQWGQFAPRHELIELRRSKHGTIAVVERDGQYSFFQSGNLVFSTAGREAPMAALEEQEAAVFAHLAMVQHRRPERVLLVGGGLRGTLGEILKHPVRRVDYVELDPVLTQAALPYVSRSTRDALADPRVNLIHTDGRLFVKAADQKYDLILVDAPDPATAALNRYYTHEFFREAEACLQPDGVLVIGATSTPDLRGAAVASRNATLYHTLASVFARVLPVGERFMLFFATHASGQVSADVPTLQERYLQRGIESEGFSAHHYHVLLAESQLRRVNWIVRNHGRDPRAHLEGPPAGPPFPDSIAGQELLEPQLPPVQPRYFINSDLKPIGYFYTLMFWDDLTRAGHRETLRWLLHVESWWLLPLALVPVLLALGLRITASRGQGRSETRLAILFAAFTTGLSTMALQIALLFSFQSIYGFVYEMVGLIVAIFMAGLALGAYLTNRYVADKANVTTLAAVQLLMALLAGFIALVLPGMAVVPSPALVFAFFSSLTFAAGLLNGVDFPLLAGCYLATNRRPERSASAIYGTELLGACLGAAAASAVVAPVLGIVACCCLAAVANGTASVVLLICRRPYAGGRCSTW